MGSLRTKPRQLDWPFALALAFLDLCFLWPLHNRGLSLFDEGSQLRMAQQAVGEAIGPRLAHPYPGFDLWYGLIFRFAHLTVENLRLETLFVMAASVWLFVLLARFLLTRWEAAAVTAMFMAWQTIFATFAYYSREANLLALAAALMTTVWIEREQRRWLILCGACLSLAIAFKFNIGILTAGALTVFLTVDRQSRRRETIFWTIGTCMLGMFVILAGSKIAGRQTDLLGNLISMPISYARALHVPIPWTYAFLLLPGVGGAAWLWRNVRERQTPQGRGILLFTVLLPFLLAQDFPRHWLAHFLWAPLPFWVLGAFVHRHLWKTPSWRLGAGLVVTAALVATGLWLEKPWSFWRQNAEIVPNERAGRIFASPSEAHAIDQVVRVIHEKVPPGEPIFIFPAQPLLYFLSERPNATIFDNLHGGSRWEDEAVAQLEKNPPRLMITVPGPGVWGLLGSQQAPKVDAWIVENHSLLAEIREPGTVPFAIYAPH